MASVVDRRKSLALFPGSESSGDGTKPVISRERKADAIPDRALRMIEAVLTYVEANAIDTDGIWMDTASEDGVEDFWQQYLDEGKDVDPPSFNVKHPSMKISQFPNIVRLYLIKYANPMIPSAALPSIRVIAMSPNQLTTESGEVIPIKAFEDKKDKNDGKKGGSRLNTPDHSKKRDSNAEPANTLTSTTLKFGQAQRIISFLSPFEQTVMGRLLVHIAALHHRACFNGLAWPAMGRAFSFLLRAVAGHDPNLCAHYTSKLLEFFISNIDSLFPKHILSMLGEAAGNDPDYGRVKLSILGQQTCTRARFRLFPGSPAAALLAKARARSKMLNKRRSTIVQLNPSLLKELSWVSQH